MYRDHGCRLRCVLLIAAVLAGLRWVGDWPTTASAQEPGQPAANDAPAKKTSSNKAILQYRAAVAFQNKQLYDLAVDEWMKFLEDFPDDPLAPKAQHYLGVCYFQIGNYAEAETAFELVIKKFPKFDALDQTLLYLGLAGFNQAQADKPEKYGEAAGRFGEIVEKFPESKHAAMAGFYLAEALYSAGKKPEAIAAYQAYLESFPEDSLRPKALYGLGVAQEEAKQSDEAAATYDAFLKGFAEHVLASEVSMRRAGITAASGDLQAAAERFAELAKLKGFAFADFALLRQAECLAGLDKHAEAAAIYASLIEQFPKSSYVNTAMLAAGKTYFLAGQYEPARQWLAKSKAQGGETQREATHWIARSHLKESKPTEALAALEGALGPAAEAKSPWLADLRMDQADAVYEVADRREEAVAMYSQIAKEHPEHREAPQAAYMAAFGSLGVRDYEAAVAHAAAFLEAFPKNDLAADVMYVAAEAKLQLKEYEEAAEQYKTLLAAYPNRPELGQWAVRRALSLSLAKNPAETIKDLTPKLAMLKEPEQIAEAQYLIGSSHFELKQYDEAIKSLTASLAAAPKWRQADETMLLLARTQRQNDPAVAVATLNKLIEQFPESNVLERAVYRLGEFKYAQGDFEGAAAAYQQVLEKWPESTLAPHARFGLGWSHLSRAEHKPAAEAMTTVIQSYAEHPLAVQAYYARAVARQQTKDFSGALEDVGAFLKSEPEGAEKFDALYVRGLSESGLQKYADAAKTFAAILKQETAPANADKVLYELAWALLQLDGKQAEANETFARLAKEHPDSPLAPEANYRVGEFYYQHKDYEKAASSYQAAIAKAGKSDIGEKASHKAAWTHFQQQDFEKAQAAFDAQAKQYPDGPLVADALVMAGESLFKQKKYEPALAAFAQAKVKKPSAPEFEIITLLHGGQSAGQLEQWEQSLKLLEECAEKFPDSAYQDEVLYEQAWALQNLGKLDEAKKLFDQVADASQTEVGARARFMAGEIQFLNKDYEGAVRSFFRVFTGYGGTDAPKPFHVWQANATFEAARCLETMAAKLNDNQKQEKEKKLAAAKRLFQDVVENYPTSDKAPDAKKKLGIP